MPTKMTKAEGGLLGARRRWGEMPRVARLDSLSPPIQEAILALIRADQAAKKDAPSLNGTPQEVGDAHDITTQPQKS